MDLLTREELGEPRFFASAFSQQVTEGNIRTKAEHGGGPVYDIGVYCINAARYLFRSEPSEVMAFSATNETDPRFRDIDEQVSVMMRFPEQRLASFTVGFGASKEGFYDVVCTEGRVRLDPAYTHTEALRREITTAKGKPKVSKFKKRDQVSAELVYFAECVTEDQTPEPSGHEGMADVRVIEAIHQSLQAGAPAPVKAVERQRRPSLDQERKEPAHGSPETVHVQSPNR